VEVKSKDEIINKLASHKESISYLELDAKYEALKILKDYAPFYKM
jgi:hypothetical protein